MSQINPRRASRSVVATSRKRPLAYSAAISFSRPAVTDLRVRAHSGALSAIASLMIPPMRPRGTRTSFGKWCIARLEARVVLRPRNANGATRPMLSRTSLHPGRVPAAVQPLSSPAVYAPLSPPPEMARKTAGGRGPL